MQGKNKVTQRKKYLKLTKSMNEFCKQISLTDFISRCSYMSHRVIDVVMISSTAIPVS